MSQTNAQKKQRKKRKDRERVIRKKRNLLNSAPSKEWRLDVEYNGSWVIGFKEFSKWAQVEKFRDDTEVLRKKGLEIIPGRVVSMSTGKVVLEINPSPAASGADKVKDKDVEMAGAEAAKDHKITLLEKSG